MTGGHRKRMRLMAVFDGKPKDGAALYFGDEVVTYGSVEARALRAAEEARSAMRPGSKVCLAAAAHPDYVTALFSLDAAEMQISLAHHALSFAELDRIVRDAGATALIGGNSQWCGQTRAVRSMPFLGDLWMHIFEPGCAANGEDHPDSALEIFTSGTDGRPKGVIKSHECLIAEGRAISAHLGYGPGVRVLCTTPLCHAYGLGMGLLGAFAGGASLVIASPRTPNLLWGCIGRSRPHILIAVPSQYELWSRGDPRKVDPGLLRLCISSGAPLSAAVARCFDEKWGRWPIQQYGMSETGAVAIDLHGVRDPDGAGKPYPGVEVMIDAPDGGPDGEGEILVRSPFLASGYVGRLEMKMPRNPFSARGFLTGDRGRLDPDGGLILVGRRGGQINVHGNKVDPAEVAAVISGHAGVHEVVVLGANTADQDQWVAAFVTADPTVSCDELLVSCQRQLAPYKCPRRVIKVDAIPRNAMGKVVAHELMATLRALESHKHGEGWDLPVS